MPINSRNLAVGVALLFAAVISSAGEATASWTHPTRYVGGGTLSVADITRTRIEYGSCSGAAFGVKAGEVVVTGAATTTVIANLAPGTYCFRAYTTAKGAESSPSNVVSKVVPQPAPEPPVLVTVDTVAYSVTTDWPSLSFVRSQVVGSVPLGLECGDAGVAGGYKLVPRAAVKWAGSNRPSYVVARCG